MSWKLRENTESIKLESKNAKSDNTQSGKTKPKRSSKNNNEVRLDFNCDEIIWELKQNINISILLGYLFYLSMLIGFAIIIFVYIFPNINNWQNILVCLFLVFAIICLSREMYNSLNLKRMYIAKDTLFINKYLGQDLELALKDCIIFTRMVTGAVNIVGVSTCEINTISTHSTLYVFLESINTNIDETHILLKHHIINYLISCDRRAYDKFKIIYQASSLKYQYGIDYKEIEQIRGVKSND